MTIKSSAGLKPNLGFEASGTHASQGPNRLALRPGDRDRATGQNCMTLWDTSAPEGC
jgi:hypothetical protein